MSIPGKQENTEVLNGPGHGYGGDHFPAPGPEGCQDGAHHRPRLDLLGPGGEKWTPRKLEVNGAAIVRRQGAVVVIHLGIIIKKLRDFQNAHLYEFGLTVQYFSRSKV